jgi:hypothetical protein
MSFKLLTTAVALSTASLSYARTFTVKNNCAETIWPAVGVLTQIDNEVLYIPSSSPISTLLQMSQIIQPGKLNLNL